jgi:nicotinate-nucleotide adenylyltransferase
MGSDSFGNIHKWKNAAAILKNYAIYIYKRPGFNVENTTGANITLLDAPLLEISSTHIRQLIKEGKSIRFLVPDSVKNEIEKNNYYK